MRGITLFLFGGVARIGTDTSSVLAEFLIAAVGPLVRLVLAGVCHAAQPLAAGIEPLLGLATYLVHINLIPGYPLDGGRVFPANV